MEKRKITVIICAIIVVSVIAGVILVYAFPHIFEGYTRITVTEGQGKVVTIGEYEYAFTYDHHLQLFAIATSITILPSTYKTTVGATYDAFGLEIQVAEVYDSYCVLLAKSTVP